MKEVKLHLGCGAIIIPGWLNYDLDPGTGGIRRDLRKPFIEHDDSVDFIFNEHFLEHLTRDAGRFFLRECRRVLRPGGVLRIVTPDLDKLARDYLKENIQCIPGTWTPATPCQMMNEGMRLWGHEFLYDFQELAAVLREAGFLSQKICAEVYRSSRHAALRGIDQRPHYGELIFEATK
jgi:predicted SAM-dependent methyltransferase